MMSKTMMKVKLYAAMAILMFAGLAGCGDSDEKASTPALGYMDVDVATAKTMIETMPELMVIDVSPYWASGHLPRAVSLPLGSGELDAAIPMLDKGKPYLVYCHGDGPSMAGATKLVEAGISKVYRLAGNYGAWRDAGYPIEM